MARARMPLALTIETADGTVGVVHADVPVLDWTQTTARLEPATSADQDTVLLGPDATQETLRWWRDQPVVGLRALIHGHCVVREVERLANRWNIDTGAGFAGSDRLALLQVNACSLRHWTIDVIEEP